MFNKGNENKRSKRETKKMRKLSTKVGLLITALFATSFIIVIGFSSVSTGVAISGTQFNELSNFTKVFRLQNQQILQTATTTVNSIENYINQTNQMRADGKANFAGDILEEGGSPLLMDSLIYDESLTELNADTEAFLIQSLTNILKVNPHLDSAGIFFEPNQFDESIRDYGFMVEQGAGGQEINLFGTYEEYSQLESYKAVKIAETTIFTNPHVFDTNTIITIAKPVMRDGTFIGMAYVDINTSIFSRIGISTEDYPSISATLYNPYHTVVFDSVAPETVGTQLQERFHIEEEITELTTKMAEGKEFRINDTTEDGEKITQFFSPIFMGGTTWWTSISVPYGEMMAERDRIVITIIIIALVALVLVVFIAQGVVRRMLSPITVCADRLDKLAVGDLTSPVTVFTSKDELERLGNSTKEVVDLLTEMITDLDGGFKELAKGNFDIESQAQHAYVGNFNPLLTSMNHIIVNMSTAFTQISKASEQVSSGAEQVSGGAQALSQGVIEQASASEELSASIAEISGQIQLTAKNAQDVKLANIKAGKELEQSNQKIQEMIIAMNDISGKSNEISKIIKTIDDIAFQTNILALNAAVEAARAGSAGKGFAVVADEVRNLAGKSAEAAKNTAILIEQTVHAVSNGAKMANSTATSMALVVDSAEEVGALVNEIANASMEQANSIEQVNVGVEQIAAVVQINSATAEESAAASEELASQAQMLKNIVEQFKIKAGPVQSVGLPAHYQENVMTTYPNDSKY